MLGKLSDGGKSVWIGLLVTVVNSYVDSTLWKRQRAAFKRDLAST